MTRKTYFGACLTAFAAIALLGGCASSGSKQSQSAVDTVQSARDSVEKTATYIKRAEDSLKTFEQQLAELRKEAQSSQSLRGRDRFLLSLSSFDGRIADARQQLQEMKLANTESWDAYKRKIQAADGVLKEEFRSRVGTSPTAPKEDGVKEF